MVILCFILQYFNAHCLKLFGDQTSKVQSAFEMAWHQTDKNWCQGWLVVLQKQNNKYIYNSYIDNNTSTTSRNNFYSNDKNMQSDQVIVV